MLPVDVEVIAAMENLKVWKKSGILFGHTRADHVKYWYIY